MSEHALRQQLLDVALALADTGLNKGKAGNVSVRWQDGMLITPSGLPYHRTQPEDMAFVHSDGSAHGPYQPSSEWRFHHDIYQHRPEAGAVVHTHAPFATTLACLEREIPAFHYMIARFGGDTVRCAPYATFGTQALSDHALAALHGRQACLLGHHGMLVFGRDLEQALDLAVELESLCEQYWRACQIAEPAVLSGAEMAVVLEKFKSYGQAQAGGASAK